jgi:ATP diphosphatase
MSADAPAGGHTALRAIVHRLRAPGGCPWDREQTHQSVKPMTIEEAYEVADAIERAAWDELEGELGDLLLQVVYHARMAEEAGRFDFAAVAGAIADKMVRRHPHVFGTDAVESAEAQTQAWEQQKARERAAKARAGKLDASVLADIPEALPALTRALKLQKRAARIGFDWPATAPVLDKLKEEIAELEVEIENGDERAREDELGDLLFSVVNLARRLGLDPETALRHGNRKFERRFRAMEDGLAPAALEGASLEELDRLWNEAKRRVG